MEMPMTVEVGIGELIMNLTLVVGGSITVDGEKQKPQRFYDPINATLVFKDADEMAECINQINGLVDKYGKSKTDI